MFVNRVLHLADEATGDVKVQASNGIVLVSYNNAAGTNYSAVFSLYNNAGTPTSVLTAGNGNNFSITEDTDAKINVFWDTDQIKVQNHSGAELEIEVKVFA